MNTGVLSLRRMAFNGSRWFACGLASVTGLLLAAGDAGAWSVSNQSSRAVRARVLPGNWEATLVPGFSAGCQWSDFSCNPSGLPTTRVSLLVETLAGDPLDFSVVVAMEAGGTGVIREVSRPAPWRAPVDLYVSGYAADGSLLQTQPFGVGAASRQVRFLISADCQFCDLTQCHEDWMPEANGNATAVNQHMVLRLLRDPSLRGICYAGDLTQFASRQEWEDQYLISIAGFERFFYDGLGNHDLSHSRIRDNVAQRKRTTVKTLKGDPHYSWDWHDVHFVQLNLMPSDTTAPQYPEHDPMNALSFLTLDLALHVGASQRPVILMHHYGFDGFSMNSGIGANGEEWWTPEQRLAYWNVIANYNVVGIFTGHLHPGPYSIADYNRFIAWNRPAGATAGPASIPTFVSGAARAGAYLEVELNNANQLSVSVRSLTEVTATRCYSHDTPVWVNQSSPAPGYGWKDDPYPSVIEAVNATTNRFACGTNVVTIAIKQGKYTEPIRITQPTRLILDGGGFARLGTGP